MYMCIYAHISIFTAGFERQRNFHFIAVHHLLCTLSQEVHVDSPHATTLSQEVHVDSPHATTLSREVHVDSPHAPTLKSGGTC